MLKPGLVSVSFRSLSPKEILTLCTENHLTAIEWGGDIHVPAGETETAREVKKLSDESGIAIAAYGSYYRIGTYGSEYRREFERVLSTAEALGAPVIRLWAYNKGSADVDTGTREKIVAECREIAALAEEKGITLTLECHNKTLTDDYHSARALLDAVGMNNFKIYYQPNQRKSEEYNLAALEMLLPDIVSVHTFHWIGKEKFPLEMGKEIWKKYIAPFRSLERDTAFLLEFMPDGEAASLQKESETLRELLKD